MSGRKLTIFAIVALVVMVVLDAVAYALLLPSLSGEDGSAPTQAAVVPTVAEQTAVPGATEFPCEPQVWWDGARETANAFFATDLFGGSDFTAEQMTQLSTDMQARRGAFAAVAYPSCLESARENLLETMDSFLAAVNAPDAAAILADGFEGQPYQSVRVVYTALADALDNAATFVQLMDEQGASLDNDDLGGLVEQARDYADLNTFDCMATRWTLTEVVPWMALVSVYTIATEDGSPDRDALRNLIFDLRSEGGRIAGAPFPNCMEDAHDALIEANDALIALIQNTLSDDLSAAQANLADFEAAMQDLNAEIRQSLRVFG